MSEVFKNIQMISEVIRAQQQNLSCFTICHPDAAKILLAEVRKLKLQKQQRRRRRNRKNKNKGF